MSSVGRLLASTQQRIERTAPRPSGKPSERFYAENREAITSRKHLFHHEMTSQWSDLVALETQSPNGQIDPNGAFPL